MPRLLCSLMLAACLVGALPASADVPVVTDSRIKTFVYNANEVFNITTHYGYQSNIEFGEKESIEAVSVGDRVAWQIIPAGRRLFIRAQEENAHTNMTVVTTQRAYQFDLRSSAADAVFGSEELTYVVRFFYPGETNNFPAVYVPPLASQAPAAPTWSAPSMAMPAPAMPVASAPLAPPAPNYYGNAPSYPSYPSYPMQAAPYASAPAQTYSAPYNPAPAPVAYSQPMSPPPATNWAAPVSYGQPNWQTPAPMPPASPAPPPAYNFRYTFSGPNNAAPVKIYDDGHSTFFKFNGAPPQQFAVVTARGEEMSVPARRTDSNTYAVDVVAPRFSLRSGAQQVIVYNESNGA